MSRLDDTLYGLAPHQPCLLLWTRGGDGSKVSGSPDRLPGVFGEREPGPGRFRERELHNRVAVTDQMLGMELWSLVDQLFPTLWQLLSSQNGRRHSAQRLKSNPRSLTPLDPCPRSPTCPPSPSARPPSVAKRSSILIQTLAPLASLLMSTSANGSLIPKMVPGGLAPWYFASMAPEILSTKT
jgi:hypothetical protein